jgi:hypothetical protein
MRDAGGPSPASKPANKRIEQQFAWVRVTVVECLLRVMLVFEEPGYLGRFERKKLAMRFS